MRKTCGQSVQTMRKLWVRTHFVPTALRHKTMQNTNNPTRYTRLPQSKSPASPTINLFKITPVASHFSPLSTALIITTTIYK